MQTETNEITFNLIYVNSEDGFYAGEWEKAQKVVAKGVSYEPSYQDDSFYSKMITDKHLDPFIIDTRDVLNKTPIFLLDENHMPEDYDEENDEIPVESLAYYSRLKMKFGRTAAVPSICLCPKRIKHFAQRTGVDAGFALAKVLLHELAHACFDVPDATFKGHYKLRKSHMHQFYEWMEESLANYFTLKALEYVDPQMMTDAVKMIQRQPANYRLSLDLLSCQIPDTLFRAWFFSNSETDYIKLVESPAAEDWLAYVKEHVGKCDPIQLRDKYEMMFGSLEPV